MRLPGARYKAVFGKGRVLRGRLMTAYALCTDEPGRRVGVVVSKKSFRRAVDRNRAKRIMRAGFAGLGDSVRDGTSWILVGRARLAGMGSPDVSREIRHLAGKAGLLAGGVS